MGDFFHGWRRKMGVVTLGLALVFMGGWMRSLATYDMIRLHVGWLDSYHGVIAFNCVDQSHVAPIDEDFGDYGGNLITGQPSKAWGCPYQSIVVPLTLFSAYLLLIKPRIAKPKTIAENRIPD